MTAAPQWIIPSWPAASRVLAVSTLRQGGVSAGVYASLNLSGNVGDNAQAVAQNRNQLQKILQLPSPPHWLRQVHGTRIQRFNAPASGHPQDWAADASVTNVPGVVCAVLTADCLPVLLCDHDGSEVAAIHAGWRGLAQGVIDAAVAQMHSPPSQLMAWLGPAIGPAAFEVGDEVRDVFVNELAAAHAAFKLLAPGTWLADLYQLARLRLHMLGVTQVYGGGRCTLSEVESFFSYRRDGSTGRMATLIWLK